MEARENIQHKGCKILDKTTFMLYILIMNTIQNAQNKVLKTLSGKIDDFYLAGGTALSLYYFHHRESLDLDFFTGNFSKIRAYEITKFLSEKLRKKIECVAEQLDKDKVKLAIYILHINRSKTLKIDFVQDYLACVKQPKLINGIKVLSLEDIYIRKLFAITGTSSSEDITGRKINKGGRQEAKDFYDLYCLSKIFLSLSRFCSKYGNQLLRESVIRWFRTYNRMDIRTGLLELKLKKDADYKEIELHFKKEIDKIISKEVEFI